jgi:hypothetical protein
MRLMNPETTSAVDFISQYIGQFNVISGGVQVSLSFTSLVIIAWIVTWSIARKRRQRRQRA